MVTLTLEVEMNKFYNKRIGSVFLFTGTRCDTPGVAIKNFKFPKKKKKTKNVLIWCVFGDAWAK